MTMEINILASNYTETTNLLTDIHTAFTGVEVHGSADLSKGREPMEAQKIILLDGPVIRCVGHGCNIDTNARYWSQGAWVPACMKSHVAAKPSRVNRRAA